MKPTKKNGRSKNFGHILITKSVKNYFALAAVLAFGASAVKWIANFGVVPLFLLAAFLFEPAFFAFLALLFSVTHVLETIGQLLYTRFFRNGINTNNLFSINLNFKPSFLPSFRPCVKGIFTFLALFNMAHAEDFILSKGESMNIPLPKLSKFNVSNKEVLNYKLNEKNKSLFIRGAKLGASDLLVWEEGSSTPKEHQVFVISKVQEAKFLHLAQLLAGLGLETKVQLPQIRVTGVLKNMKQYLQYKKIQSLQNELILDETTLERGLKHEILADVYQLFFNDYKDSVACKVHYSDIICSYPANEAPAENLKKLLAEKYRVTLLELNNQKLKNNYSFKLKLIQLEQLDGEELRLGLEQLSTSLGDLLKVPLNKIVEKNAVLLAQKKVQMNTLAEPSGLIRPLSPAEFQIGADIPYTITSKEGIANTTWQFAGLKVRITLENMGDKIKISYETELTKPTPDNSNSISGNKERSSVVIELNSATQLFQVVLKTDAKGVDQMPFLNRIPVLGELFKSRSSQSNYKMITGILEVKDHE